MRLQSALVVTIVVVLAACGGGPAADQPTESSETVDKLVIYTVNYPLAYFAERIGGDLVEVHFPAPADEDPAFWSPDADTIAAFQAADLILLNGAGYAKWVERAALPSSRVVNTSGGFTDQLLPIEGTVTHSHGPEGEHEHTELAFTTWLDPELAIQQAQAIEAAISVVWPDNEPEIGQRMERLKSDLFDIDPGIATQVGVIDLSNLAVRTLQLTHSPAHIYALQPPPDTTPDAESRAVVVDRSRPTLSLAKACLI